jgi:hypothetical protein
MEQIQILQLNLDEFRALLSDVVKEHLKQLNKAPSEELLTINEVASRLKISKPSLHKYSDMGILTRHKIGERVYYRWSEILAAAKKIECPKSINS